MSEWTAVSPDVRRSMAVRTMFFCISPGQSIARIMLPYRRIAGPRYGWRYSISASGLTAVRRFVSSVISRSTASGTLRVSRPAKFSSTAGSFSPASSENCPT